MFSTTFHRSLLNEQLRKYAPLLTGAILDIGSKNRRYDSLLKGHVTAVDIVPDLEKKVGYANLDEVLPFADNSFNGILCAEVLEYVHDAPHAFQELYRVLLPNGVLLLSVPFMYHDHDDWARYTAQTLQEAARPFSSVQCITFGTGWTIISDIVLKKSFQTSNFLLRASGLSFLVVYNFCIRFLKLDRVQDCYYSGILLVCRK